MTRVTLYELTGDFEEGRPYTATLSEAGKLREFYGDCGIDKVTSVELPLRQLAALIATGRHWIAARETIVEQPE